MADAPEKPMILQEQTFTVHESWPYRFLRGGSIQLNKLMFAALILLAIWLLWATATGDKGCTYVPHVLEDNTDGGETQSCSVWLTPTTRYLAVMSILSFIGSIGFGLLGLVVGKRIVEATATEDEVGARRAPGPASDETSGTGDDGTP